MQNVQVPPQSLLGDKIAAESSDAPKKLHSPAAPPETTECSRVPRVASSRDHHQAAPSSQQGERHFQATVVADKYLLLDQVEGSSLYRCMDVNTQEELVCKVRGGAGWGRSRTRWVYALSMRWRRGLVWKQQFFAVPLREVLI